MTGKRGMAVMMVLGVLVIVFGLALAFVNYVKLGRDNGSDQADVWRARIAAETGLADALDVLENHFDGGRVTGWDRWRVVSGSSYHAVIDDQCAKWNINASSEADDRGDNVWRRLGFDADAMRLKKRNALWFSSVDEVLGWTTKSSEDFYKNDFSGMAVHGYDWAYGIERRPGQRKINMWSLVEDDFSLSEDDLNDLFDEGVQGQRDVQKLLWIKDAWDGDADVTAFRGLLGREVQPYIHEVCFRRTTLAPYAEQGEFIEIYNPYDRAILLNEYVLEWESHHVKKSLPLTGTLAPHGFVVVTDDSRRLFNIEGVRPDEMVILEEQAGFDCDPSLVQLVYQHRVCDKVNLARWPLLDADDSVERADPRSDDNTNYIQNHATPGRLDRKGLSEVLPPSYSDISLEQRFEHDQGWQSWEAVRRVYGGEEPWGYLQWHTSYVQDKDGDGSISAEEAGDLALLDILVNEDENALNYYDREDGADPHFKHRLVGRININTASRDILALYFGGSEVIADSIITARRVRPFVHIYDVVLPLRDALGGDEEAVNDMFAAVIDKIAVRSYVFMITVQGVAGRQKQLLQAEVECGFFVQDGRRVPLEHPRVLSRRVLVGE